MTEAAEKQRLYDRQNAEYAQAKGHNQRVKERYPEAWATSTITNALLADWVIEYKGKPCPYCDSPALEIDHMVPLSRGGVHGFENLTMLCLPCNRAKHDLTDEEFRQIRPYVGQEAHQDGPRFEIVTIDNLEEVRTMYLKVGDPTEYKAAIAILGSLQGWTSLCAKEWFLEALRGWRAELRARLKSEAIERLIGIAASGSAASLTAIKTLVTEDYLYTPYVDFGDVEIRRGPGRPEKVLFIEPIPQDILNEDAGRIGLQNI